MRNNMLIASRQRVMLPAAARHGYGGEDERVTRERVIGLLRALLLLMFYDMYTRAHYAAAAAMPPCRCRLITLRRCRRWLRCRRYATPPLAPLLLMRFCYAADAMLLRHYTPYAMCFRHAAAMPPAYALRRHCLMTP